MKKLIAKAILLIVCFQFAWVARAQYATEVYLTDLDNAPLKEKVQQAIGKLLTEINTAQANNSQPYFSGLNISKDAQNTIMMLWDNTPFRCGETEVIERCLKNGKEFQVRNIPLFLTIKDDNSTQDKYQEAVIGFDRNGMITDFHLALATNLYTKVLKSNQAVSDFRYRQMILDYVEQFRTAYNTKDINFLNQIFSDDALIITGKVVKAVPTDMNKFMPDPKVIYTKQTKKEYLTNLTNIFKTNKRINVIFDDINVIRHPAKPNFYGVTLKQGYTSDRYSDVGYLFLLWDFTNEDAPKIHVRTWQPEMLDQYTKLPEEEIFQVEDFDI